MTKYLKNFMASVAVMSQLLAMLILLFEQGATSNTDQIFLCLTFVSIMQFLLVMPFDQFVVFYNRNKVLGIGVARNFYSSVLLAATATSVFFTVIVLIVAVSTSLFKGEGLLNADVMYGFILGLIAYPFVALNDRFYNAEGMILNSYALVIFPQVCLLAGIALWSYTINIGPEYVGYAYAVGMWSGALCSLLTVVRRFGFSLDVNVQELIQFFINSFSVRFGQNIYPIVLQGISNGFLSLMGPGAVSIFNYAYKGIASIFIVAVGPSNRVFMYELSILASRKRLDEYGLHAREYLKDSLRIYWLLVILSLVGIFLLAHIDLILSSLSIDIDFILLGVTFIVVAVWQALVVIESVHVGVIVTAARPLPFLYVNALFAIIFSALAYAALLIDVVYCFAFAGLLSQIVSFLFYKYFSTSILYGVRLSGQRDI